MADRGVDLSALPKEVRDQLAELDLELSEGKLWLGLMVLSCGADGCRVKCVWSVFTSDRSQTRRGAAVDPGTYA